MLKWKEQQKNFIPQKQPTFDTPLRAYRFWNQTQCAFDIRIPGLFYRF
jgi:hypothetical protein